jgi:tRNA wybutosine-synthesizing protein 3
MGFELDKENILSKIDKSKIGSIDKNIQEICDLINSKSEYYTTSSCSGRIVLLESNSSKKDEAKWLFVSHESTDFESIKEIESKSDVWLRQEGAIIHVCCKTIQDAEKLINLVKSIGFKRAGMISVNNRFVVEIISSEHLCAPVMKNGLKIVSDEYLKVLLEESNRKMNQNKEKLEKLRSIITQM